MPPPIPEPLRCGPAKITHNGAGRAEQRCDILQLWEDGVGSFGGDLPCAQDPATPSGKGHQQCASSILPRCVDVKRPTAIVLERCSEPGRRGAMKDFKVDQEAPAELADFAARGRDAIVGLEQRRDFGALAMVNKAFQPHTRTMTS